MSYFAILLFCSLVPALAMLVQMVWLGCSQNDGAAPELSDEQMRRFILWRSFYVNPDDPRGWVPKVSGYGWTVNFRSRSNAIVFAGLAATSLGSALLLTIWALTLGG